jgi:hypothetical protein
MRNLFSFLTLLTWALWLGGMVTLFICVMALFHTERASAIVAAPHMFLIFERYQLVLAAIALSSTFAWRFTTRLPPLVALFVLLTLAALGAVATPMYVTKKMGELRAENKVSSPEFQQLHRKATWIYRAQAVLLLAAGFPLLLGLRGQGRLDQTPTPPTPA